MLDTTAIPQADLLWDVARVAEAVAGGATTPSAIGAYLGAKGERQGNYYMQAARLLGLVQDGGWADELTLTRSGKVFLAANRDERRDLLRRAVLHVAPAREVLQRVASRGGMDRDSIAALLQSLAPISASTARRRTQTVTAWLCTAGLAVWNDGRLMARYAPRQRPTMVQSAAAPF